MHAVFVLSVSCQINQIFECLVNLSRSFMVRSPPGTPTIIAKSSLLSCWYVKHPIINYTPPIPLGLVRVVMLCWLMTDFHDRLNEREELSPTDSAENRAFHDSIHRYRNLDWTNERTNDSERLFLANWPTRTESRKIIVESITSWCGLPQFEKASNLDLLPHFWPIGYFSHLFPHWLGDSFLRANRPWGTISRYLIWPAVM